jgi:hypothetical protein
VGSYDYGNDAEHELKSAASASMKFEEFRICEEDLFVEEAP